MGCLHSKKEPSDLHPNVFRVVNIDENGGHLCSGQLEITESDLILYREGRESTVWPLHSLRRYGFEEEIFSFESGRRCETGAGIYAFRCRRASLLFHNLQQRIQLRNVIRDTVPYPVSRLNGTASSLQARQTLQASVVHRSSIDNGQGEGNTSQVNNNTSLPQASAARTITQSQRSPSSADMILELMPLYPRPQSNNCSHVTNVYQLNEFKREHNNNHDFPTEVQHLYCNDLNRDLAILRNSLRQEAVLSTMRELHDESLFLESMNIDKRLINTTANQLLSPTTSTHSEHYAQLNIGQQDNARLYMNLVPNADSLTCRVDKIDAVPATPLTPNQVNYSNLSTHNKFELNSYANLTIGDMVDGTKHFSRHNANFSHSSAENQRFFEFETFTPMSPNEETDINYAVLDIDTNKTAKVNKDIILEHNCSTEKKVAGGSQLQSKDVLSSSIDKPIVIGVTSSANIGYTTIDFDKTVALTSVAAGDVEADGSRKTRHDVTNPPCGSPNSSDKFKDF